MNKSIKRVLGESVQPLEVIETTKPVAVYECPHCKVEIHERHQYTTDGGESWFHSDCQGPIVWPPKSIREQNEKDKAEGKGIWGWFKDSKGE